MFAQLPELFDLNGYKDLKFGMSIDEANNKITNYNLNVYADFLESFELKNNRIINIYKNDTEKLAYYLYFYNNELYRIEICNHIGDIYNNPSFYNPASLAEIDDIKEKLKFKYGEITKTDVKYYSFNKKPFEEYTIWWSSDLASVSLYVKPDLDSLDRVIKLYSYRISFYDEIRLKEIYSSN
ncbi:hypothetical protein Q5M87_09200 [Brachyspira innocens]|uniref:DUF3298 domain-containing protein n=2 Tax=Brachyspira innocens TaxID=13264 RepID=A0ABT8Z237_9SPIR|nr:hypothetical protein [Brachyspira innocens]MDO6994183.1 hypothetical protein [Brachyspira innocens]MDO7021693.1 hypothetical protein [Brachyspira innocens]